MALCWDALLKYICGGPLWNHFREGMLILFNPLVGAALPCACHQAVVVGVVQARARFLRSVEVEHGALAALITSQCTVWAEGLSPAGQGTYKRLDGAQLYWRIQ